MLANLQISLNAVIPFLFYLSMGYIIVALKWGSRDFLKELNKLVFKIFFPFLMFYNIYNINVENFPSLKLLLFAPLSILTTIIVLMIIVPRIVKENDKRGVIIQATYRSNFLMYGFGLTQVLYGEEQARIAGILLMIVISIFNISSVIVLETFNGNQRTSFLTLLKRLLENPLLQGCIIGLIFFTFKIKLPKVLEKPIGTISNIATPLAMITLGGELTFKSILKNIKIVSIVTFLKLIVLPIIMITIAYQIGLRGIELFLVLTIFATPVATSSYPMAVNMGGDGKLAGELIFISTIVSIPTIFLFIFTLTNTHILTIS